MADADRQPAGLHFAFETGDQRRDRRDRRAVIATGRRNALPRDDLGRVAQHDAFDLGAAEVDADPEHAGNPSGFGRHCAGS